MRPGRAAAALVLRTAPPSFTPRVMKAIWRGFYGLASRRGHADLMNYGYAVPGDGPSADPDHFGRRLYAHVACAAELAGRDVLEVGCGRGGGAAFVLEQFHPRSVTGLDLSKAAIARCRAEHAAPGLTFVAGDAERLPFAAGAFDAVLSVESSHCYPDVPRFLAEAARVLRPGGVLLIADFRHTVLPEGAEDALVRQEDVACLRAQIAAAGFRVLEEEDVTANVLEALRLDTPNRRARLERGVPRPLRQHALAFAAVEGGAMYRAYEQGQWTYLRFALQRP